MSRELRFGVPLSPLGDAERRCACADAPGGRQPQLHPRLQPPDAVSERAVVGTALVAVSAARKLKHSCFTRLPYRREQAALQAALQAAGPVLAVFAHVGVVRHATPRFAPKTFANCAANRHALPPAYEPSPLHSIGRAHMVNSRSTQADVSRVV